MWVAELKIFRKFSRVVKATQGLDVSIASYNLNIFNKGGRSFVNKVALISGSDAKKFIDFFVSSRPGIVRKVEGNQIFYQHDALDGFNTEVVTSSVIFLKPIIGKGGSEFWTIGSWEKEELSKLVRKMRSIKGIKVWLLSLKEEPVDIFVPNVLARLSKKQAEALRLAFQAGYYAFPRKQSLEEIANKLGLNESTFREHLRKAEAKVMESVMRQSL